VLSARVQRVRTAAARIVGRVDAMPRFITRDRDDELGYYVTHDSVG
jgi:hypothetical protein